jgi:alpha-L-fucosidase
MRIDGLFANGAVRLCACLLLVALITAPATTALAEEREAPIAVPPVAETAAEFDERMAWWRDARFGMFIHWGLYSVAGGEWDDQQGKLIASWMMHELHVPPDQYSAKLRPGFTADKFDPTAWAKLAKRAGMKYAVLTAKHHEGFCLFDSKLTDFDVTATPAKRDLVRPYLDAFRAEGLKAGLYFSVIDWHHPDYPVEGDDLHPMRFDTEYKNQQRDLDKYVDYMHGQVRELATNYGPIDIMWWDFSYGRMSGETWRANELIAMTRSLQPSIIMNNRLYADAYTNRQGDFTTPEQFIPSGGLDRDWETCMTINDTWGFKPHDLNFKSSTQLIRMLTETASKGGNFLLNVGPRPDGSIPEELIERLEDMGKWMDVNGEAIYGTTASPFSRQPAWGRCTTGKTNGSLTPIYLHVHDWPTNGKLVLWPLENEVVTAYLLADKQRNSLPVSATEEAITISGLPDKPLHDAATVLVLEVKGQPVPAPILCRPNEQGQFLLRAADADLHGESIRYASEADSIGFWTNLDDWASWPLAVPADGTHRVTVTYGCDNDSGGEFVVSVGDEELHATTEPTGGWHNRVTKPIGSIKLPAGTTELAIRLKTKRGIAVMDLVKVALEPVD